MKFVVSQLQQHVERVYAVETGLPEDQLPVCGLLDACQWFTLTEGEHSPRVREALTHLLSSELRPSVRRWYQRYGESMNPAAIEFRDRLAEMAGEKFGRDVFCRLTRPTER